MIGTTRVWETKNATAANPTWTAISNVLGGSTVAEQYVTALAIAPSDSKTIYAATADGHVWATANAGTAGRRRTRASSAPAPAGSSTSGSTRPIRSAPSPSAPARGASGSSTRSPACPAGRTSQVTSDLPPVRLDPPRLAVRDPAALPRDFEGRLPLGQPGTHWSVFALDMPNTNVTDLQSTSADILYAGTFGRGAWAIGIAPSKITGTVAALEGDRGGARRARRPGGRRCRRSRGGRGRRPGRDRDHQREGRLHLRQGSARELPPSSRRLRPDLWPPTIPRFTSRSGARTSGISTSPIASTPVLRRVDAVHPPGQPRRPAGPPAGEPGGGARRDHTRRSEGEDGKGLTVGLHTRTSTRPPGHWSTVAQECATGVLSLATRCDGGEARRPSWAARHGGAVRDPARALGAGRADRAALRQLDAGADEHRCPVRVRRDGGVRDQPHARRADQVRRVALRRPRPHVPRAPPERPGGVRAARGSRVPRLRRARRPSRSRRASTS